MSIEEQLADAIMSRECHALLFGESKPEPDPCPCGDPADCDDC